MGSLSTLTSACSEPTNDQYAAYESLLTQAQQNAENSATDIPLWQALSGLSNSGQTRDSELFQYHLAVALSEAGIRDEAITILRPLSAGTATFDEKDDATRLLERLNRR